MTTFLEEEKVFLLPLELEKSKRTFDKNNE